MAEYPYLDPDMDALVKWQSKNMPNPDIEITERHTVTLDPNRPANHLIDVAPDTEITDPCGCNQPAAVHQRGDAGFCRATLATGVGYA